MEPEFQIFYGILIFSSIQFLWEQYLLLRQVNQFDSITYSHSWHRYNTSFFIIYCNTFHSQKCGKKCNDFIIMFLFLFRCLLFQRKTYKSTDKLSEELTNVMSIETFNKSKPYNMEKNTLAMVKDWIFMIISTVSKISTKEWEEKKYSLKSHVKAIFLNTFLDYFTITNYIFWH